MSPLRLAFLFTIAIFILITRLFFFFVTNTSYPEGKIISFTTTVSTAPKIGANYQQISFVTPNHQRGFVRLPQEPTVAYGDVVEVSGSVSYISVSSGNKILSLNYPKFKIIAQDRSFISQLRKQVIEFFSNTLDRNNSALMLGIVFGIKQDFSPNFASNIQKTGLLHVIAASGMNITMVGGFFSAFLAFFLRRRLAAILTIGLLCFYALLAGLEPSIIRAAIMGILVFTAQILGRQSTSFVALFLAGFAMIMVDPSLILDTGFQLSFMATFGLVFFRPIIYGISRLKPIIEKSALGEDLLTTITAQIFTLPILLLSFSNYSPASIISNMLVLWTVPILMIIGGLGVVISFVLEPLGKLIIILSLPLLSFFISVVNFVGQRATVFTLQNVPSSIVVGYYLILISFVFRFSKSRGANDTK